jgi:hypothetical protein
MSAGVGTGAGIGLNSNTWSIGEEMFKNDYYVYILEQMGGDFLRGRIDGEFWLNDSTRVLNFFQKLTSYTPPAGSRSFYGTSESGWLTFQTTSNLNDWWGLGMYVSGESLSFGPSGNSVFHMAVRIQETQPSANRFTVGVGGINSSEGQFTVKDVNSPGSADFNIEFGTSEWQVIEVPLSLLLSRGMGRYGSMQNQNYLTITGGSSDDIKLEVDAVYFYNQSGIMP